MNTVKCNNCNWEGVEDELDVFEDTTKVIESIDRCFFKGCPHCKKDDFLMDINVNNFLTGEVLTNKNK
jgi:hypothetical protein